LNIGHEHNVIVSTRPFSFLFGWLVCWFYGV